MKNIDVKSLIIGALLTSTVLLGVAATSPTDKWDDKQVWQSTFYTERPTRAQITGWEPYTAIAGPDGGIIFFRKRIK
jgi:hypothetical protein